MTPGATDSEAELIRRAQGGDRRAFELIALSHLESLLRGALTLCRERHLAEDIVQETLWEGWRSIGRYDGRCRLSTWLYGILRHRHLKGVRQTVRSRLCEWTTDADSSQPDSSVDPASLSQQAEDAVRVRRAVADLPSEHAQVIELRFFADASLDDIAAALEIPVGTVKSRLHHGLEKLRQQRISVNLFAAAGESPVRSS